MTGPLFPTPPGFRLLEVGEAIREGDHASDKERTEFQEYQTFLDGEIVSERSGNFYFRRIPEPEGGKIVPASPGAEAPSEPECGFCDDSKRVDSGGQDGAGNWIDIECSHCRPVLPVEGAGAALILDFEIALEKFHSGSDVRYRMDIPRARDALANRLASMEKALKDIRYTIMWKDDGPVPDSVQMIDAIAAAALQEGK